VARQLGGSCRSTESRRRHGRRILVATVEPPPSFWAVEGPPQRATDLNGDQGEHRSCAAVPHTATMTRQKSGSLSTPSPFLLPYSNPSRRHRSSPLFSSRRADPEGLDELDVRWCVPGSMAIGTSGACPQGRPDGLSRRASIRAPVKIRLDHVTPQPAFAHGRATLWLRTAHQFLRERLLVRG